MKLFKDPLSLITTFPTAKSSFQIVPRAAGEGKEEFIQKEWLTLKIRQQNKKPVTSTELERVSHSPHLSKDTGAVLHLRLLGLETV